MEHQQILNWLNEASDSKFATRNWNIANDQSNANYRAGNEILYSSEVLKSRSNLCDYDDAYILVIGDIIITGRNLPTEANLKIVLHLLGVSQKWCKNSRWCC